MCCRSFPTEKLCVEQLTLLDERDATFEIPKGVDEDIIDPGRLDMSDIAFEGAIFERKPYNKL